jgi:Bacterial Ig domain
VAPDPQLQPVDGATDVSPLAVVRASGGAGTLRAVALTAADGSEVAGAVPGRRSVDGQCAAGLRRPIHLVGADRRPWWQHYAADRILAPSRLVHATTNVNNGDTVGVAAPIEVQFDEHLDDTAKAAAETRMRVTTLGRSQRAGGGEEGGVLQHGEHLAALQFAEHLRPRDTGTGVDGDEVLVEGQP